MKLFEHKHRYEPRYDEKPHGSLNGVNCSGYCMKELRTLIFYKVYVCDICTGCGHKINRSNVDTTEGK